jgi:diguanylate cyclase (GGDEF)-like protein
MLFPDIEEIATTDVAVLPADHTIQQALDEMVRRGIRNVVVENTENGEYGIFTANDLIRLHTLQEGLDITLMQAGYSPLHKARCGDNILETIEHLSEKDDYLYVVDDKDKLFGIISYTDIISSVDPKILMERQRIGDIVGRHRFKTASQDTTLKEIYSELTAVDEAVVITDEKGNPAGLLSTVDAIALIKEEVDHNQPCSRYMSAPLHTVPENVSIREAISLLEEKQFKRLFVTDKQGELLGMVTQKELTEIAYNRWSDLLVKHAQEMQELLQLMEKKASRLQELSYTDELTAISNRRKFKEALDHEVRRNRRYSEQPFSIVLMDIDHFKQVNDKFGHSAGDKMLRHMVTTICPYVRDTDLFARWGGEEFVLMLPHTLASDALVTAERIRLAVESKELEDFGGVTLSLGITQYQAPESDDALFVRADQALYRAKSMGRNRTEVIMPPEETTAE